MAYWLIGREIVQELQGGEERATYGKQLLDTLSSHLTKRYGVDMKSVMLRKYVHCYLPWCLMGNDYD